MWRLYIMYRHIQRAVLWYEAANVYAFKFSRPTALPYTGMGGAAGNVARQLPVEQARE